MGLKSPRNNNQYARRLTARVLIVVCLTVFLVSQATAECMATALPDNSGGVASVGVTGHHHPIAGAFCAGDLNPLSDGAHVAYRLHQPTLLSTPDLAPRRTTHPVAAVEWPLRGTPPATSPIYLRTARLRL